MEDVMKNLVKIFAVLGLLPLFFACTTNNKQEEKFVNPIFYETLEPYSAVASCAKLTPTTLYWSSYIRYDCDKWLNEDINNEEKTMKYDCQLLKNTETELVYLCNMDIETFTIRRPGETDIPCDKAVVRYQSCNKNHPDICGSAHLCIK